MLILKIMGLENGPDEDTRKTYRLLTGVRCVEFNRIGQIASDSDAMPSFTAEASVTFDDDQCEVFPLGGNVYVMNEAGKTISSFCPSPLPADIVLKPRER
jgi:hypothetical protein